MRKRYNSKKNVFKTLITIVSSPLHVWNIDETIHETIGSLCVEKYTIKPSIAASVMRTLKEVCILVY